MNGTGMSAGGPSIRAKITSSPASVQRLPAKARTARTNWPRKGAEYHCRRNAGSVFAAVRPVKPLDEEKLAAVGSVSD